jgi:hypothetical protein
MSRRYTKAPAPKPSVPPKDDWSYVFCFTCKKYVHRDQWSSHHRRHYRRRPWTKRGR